MWTGLVGSIRGHILYSKGRSVSRVCWQSVGRVGGQGRLTVLLGMVSGQGLLAGWEGSMSSDRRQRRWAGLVGIVCERISGQRSLGYTGSVYTGRWTESVNRIGGQR